MVRAFDVVARVVDPEIRVLTIDELGILRGVVEDPVSGAVTVTITPTYSGCPAMDVIRAEIRDALVRAGYVDSRVETVLSPPWTTDRISPSGRRKLAAAGIAPPVRTSERADAGVASALAFRGVVALRLSVVCPRCRSLDTEELSRFGSTACRALWRCRACSEPFDHFKAL